MKGRAIIPLVVGLGIGLLAIKLGFDYISKAKGQSVDTDVVKVLTCAKDIPITMQISKDMVAAADVPRALLPPQFIPAKEAENIVGRVAAVMMSKGSPMLERMLAPKGTPPGLVVRIPAGYRAIAVRVAEEQQAGGWIVPGAHVDVSAIFQVKKATSRNPVTVSKVILEDVEVVAVGQMLGNESKEQGANIVKSVTLLVKAEDVPKLHYAQTKGKVTFAVRHQGESSTGDFASIDEDEFFSTGKPKTDEDEQSDPPKDKRSALSGLLAAAMTKAMTTPSGQPAEQNAPFRVEVINGSEQEEKIYVNDQSRVEFKDRSAPARLRTNRPPSAPTGNPPPSSLFDQRTDANQPSNSNATDAKDDE